MAKRTAIIDIGSNSVRIVIYEKTSRFAFHLLREAKSKVRIGEGAYNKNGHLQEPAMLRAFETIEEFVSLAKAYKCRKILAVATSALRDAPNKKIFLNKIKNKLGINIRIINGNEEAYLGGIAVANMLPNDNGVSIDIGGGSTELARIEKGLVVETVSLDIGTVRLKELFCDEKKKEEAIAFVGQACTSIPETFLSLDVIGIGGTIRALTRAFIKYEKYPIKVLHGFSYNTKAIEAFSLKLIGASANKLKKLEIKEERFDIMSAGALIFTELLGYLKTPSITASSVGVREGVYIKDMLRTQKQHRFPGNINPTFRSIVDRYIEDTTFASLFQQTTLTLFDMLKEPLNLQEEYRELLGYSAKLAHIGIELNYYDFERHSFYLILHSLYGMTHQQTLLIATLVRYHTKKKPSKAFYKKYDALLPKHKKVKRLIFILALADALLQANPNKVPFEISVKKGELYLRKLANNHLAIEKVLTLEAPIPIHIID